VSFSEDVAQFGDHLVRLVSAGVAVREAAAALGITRSGAAGTTYGSTALITRSASPLSRPTLSECILESGALRGVGVGAGEFLVPPHGLRPELQPEMDDG
jgi:hypothetical protein